MAGDIAVSDQAMDIDMNVPSVGSTVDTSSATPVNGLPARRRLPKQTDKRGYHNSIQNLPNAKVQKRAPKANISVPRDLTRTERLKLSSRQKKQKQRLQKAIADGSFKIQMPIHVGSLPTMEQGKVAHIERLNKDLVTQALYAPTPGLTFDTAQPSLGKFETGDLLLALEAYQMYLAGKGRIILSHNAPVLLKAFTRDVLSTALSLPKKLDYQAGMGDFWTQVAVEYQQSKRMRRLVSKVMTMLKGVHHEPFPPWEKGASDAARRAAIRSAFGAPGEHPSIDEAIARVMEGKKPRFAVAQPSTIQAIMSHFEAARSRYLSNLNTSNNWANQRDPGSHKPTPPFALPPRNLDLDDSSDDEDCGVRGGVSDGDIEDNGQVEDGELRGRSQRFIMKLDKWMAFKNGQQQDSIDADMLSALDLGNAK
ncbi:hypothetical protein J7T55_007568 [Diaporthe amygdali]|uniref:uncharacterized protein n=1 Tax=Phomopsis amygdali TaxID=1214568 RepID=UPI0022FE0059|nr:uncharacterized protein J7T55_007568 [Diaporthe amygdali]KAJ0107198.1 hypothetical protein J7T55_007568 [Diaporthe amygdali]